MIETDTCEPKMRDRSLLLTVVLIGCLLGGSVLLGGCERQPEEQLPASQAETGETLMARDVILYFAAPNGSRLVAENRQVAGCADDTGCIKAVVAALAAGPDGGTAQVLPAEAVLQEIAVDGSTVTLDFNAAFVRDHPGGTRSELLTVYALADTLAANFPHLRQFRFQVEGEPVDTIKGHVDLRQPVTPDFSLVEESATTAGDLSDIPARSE